MCFQDLPSTIKQVAEFLGKTLSDAEVVNLSQYLHINNFRKNTAVNLDLLKEIGMLYNGEQEFIRKGMNPMT